MGEALTPEEGLLAAARTAREFAQAQYSKFKVGAALETVDGQIVTGCNIENATYGLTLCAERVALVKALSEGHTVFTRIAVVADTEAPTPPCGPCRQLLWEYCGDLEVVLGNLRAADRPPPPFGAAAAAVRSAAVVRRAPATDERACVNSQLQCRTPNFQDTYSNWFPWALEVGSWELSP